MGAPPLRSPEDLGKGHEVHEWPQIWRHLSQLVSVNSCGLVSGADGIGDTEGKAAMGSGERSGRQASFTFVSLINRSPFLMRRSADVSVLQWA